MLSFEKYDPVKPLVAYRQFVECFVVPLVLASYKSTAFIKQLQLNPEGIPIAFAAKILPFISRFRLSVFLHIFLPGSINANRRKTSAVKQHAIFSRQKLLNIVNNLESLISSLKPARINSNWNIYYEETILSNEYLQEKSMLVKKWLNELEGNIAIDIGTNTGAFAFDAANRYNNVIAIDADELCINELYKKCKTSQNKKVMPLCIDIANPTPAIGWANEERMSFVSRVTADLVIALAVLHHLVIGRNISMMQVVSLFKKMTEFLLVEFVPKEDPKVVAMLSDREDIFESYHQQYFEMCFSREFNILKNEFIKSSSRVIYLMQKK